MKKYANLLVVIASFMLLNCNDDDTKSTAPDDEDIKPLVDRITVNSEELTIPANTYNPGNYSVWFSLIGNKMVYANPSNTAMNQFMTSFHIQNGYFSNLPIHDEVCACGYGSKFVNDGINLYYIANEAWKLNISNNTWAELNYPSSAKENNGETGIVYHSNKIYFLGGRDASPRFKYYDTNSNSWHNLTDYNYAVETPDLTVLNNRIYVLGGESSGKRFSYFENGNWTALPDLDFTPKNSSSEHSVASFGNRFIFAMVNSELHIYDSVEEIWSEQPINLGFLGSYPNLFSDNNYLYIGYKDYENQFQLKKLTVNIP